LSQTRWELAKRGAPFTDPITGHTNVDTKGYPSVQGGGERDGLTICFDSQTSTSTYEEDKQG
jgi:hypothetical protein